MTSLKQIEANRRNAQQSTGPRTENGKRHSRRNAIRHGLCAETVIEILEDIDDYRAFEAAIISDYNAQTAVKRELVLRLASLLWRLRRATAIETDLLRTQAEILRDRPRACEPSAQSDRPAQDLVCNIQGGPIPPDPPPDSEQDRDENHDLMLVDNHSRQPGRSSSSENPINHSRELTYCFQRLTNLDNGAFERLSRYESALWRQTIQTLFALQSAKRW